jgi:TonB family protein
VDLQGLGDSFEVGLKFWVSPEGKVESVERVASSGHPTVDIVAMRYLKGWQFVPVKAGEDYEKQWGAVKLSLKLEKAAGR